MSVKPILFNTDMVRAILDGRKTVTRRLGTWKIESYSDNGEINAKTIRATKRSETTSHFYGCKQDFYEMHSTYQPGDILWVQETWNVFLSYPSTFGFDVEYKADCSIRPCIFNLERYSKFEKFEGKNGWQSPYFMPKEAARIWLKVTSVRVERLQDITEKQAKSEGENGLKYNSKTGEELSAALDWFPFTWNNTIKKLDIDRYGWEANPWVWVIEFERCEKPQEVEH